MKSWNELSMAEKADVMKLAVEGGVYDLDAIRSGYNEYAKGGKIHIDPSKKGTFTAAASKHGMGVQQFASKVLAHPENYSPAMVKKANFARNAAKWKHAYGGELGNYYDGWGDAWNSLKKGYYDTKAKAKKAIKDLGLDRGPIEHIVNRAITASKDIRDNRNSELSIPVSLALNAGRIVGINKAIKASDSDTQYRQNLYNLIDPTDAIPESFEEVANHAKAVRKAKSGNNYSYRRKYNDKAADAAWAKRLGLPYNNTILIDNLDGSVHLAEYLENEIPTDTTFIKTRIADNEKLRDKTYGPDRGKIEAALNIDKAALDSLRHTYKTGEPVEMSEFSHVNRHLFNNGETTPLNLMHRYTIQYNKGNNTMDYRDIYDFDGFEDYIPGKPFNIRGSINLNKKK